MKISENLFWSNPHYNLYHIAQNNIVVIEAYGKIRMETAQEAWLKALDKAEEKNTTHWIHDQSQVELIHPKVNEWCANEWYVLAGERLKFPGKRLTATVLSPRFYAEMSAKQAISGIARFNALVDRQSKHLEHWYFKTYAEAHEWIANHPERDA